MGCYNLRLTSTGLRDDNLLTSVYEMLYVQFVSQLQFEKCITYSNVGKLYHPESTLDCVHAIIISMLNNSRAIIK